MSARTVLVVIGTRPEAIKMAPVVAGLRAHAPELRTRVVLTGQHTTLVDQVLRAFELDVDYDLDIMAVDQSLYDVVHRALDGLRGVVRDCRPDALLVQGDTATVFAAALVGYFERVKVGHVEAGLRTGDKWAPFPEEVFRHLTDVLADYYFAPTGGARDHLLREGVSPDRIHVTGNTVVDAVQAAAGRTHKVEDAALAGVLGDAGRRLVLLTAHRRESFGAPLREIFGAVREIADEHPDIGIVYPVHPNPSVTGPAQELLSGHPRIHLTEPLGYLDVIAALKGASLVLTDSGGIQEEAPTLGAPVLVLRRVTERPEGLVAGAQEMVGTDRERILRAARTVLAGSGRAPRPNAYGDGAAGARIADVVRADLTGHPRTTEDWDG